MPLEQMPDIAPWLQLGFAVAVAWYLLTKALPRMEDRAEKRDEAFLTALTQERDEHRQENHRLEQAQDRNTERILDALNGAHGGRSNGSGRG